MMNSPPVREGEEFNLVIEAVGKKGDGIAKINGYTIIIPGTKMDQKVKAKMTKVTDKFAFAEVVTDDTDAKNTPKDSEKDSENFGEEENKEK